VLRVGKYDVASAHAVVMEDRRRVTTSMAREMKCFTAVIGEVVVLEGFASDPVMMSLLLLLSSSLFLLVQLLSLL